MKASQIDVLAAHAGQRDTKAYVTKLLNKHQTVKDAAAAIGINHRTLSSYLRKHKIQRYVRVEWAVQEQAS